MALDAKMAVRLAKAWLADQYVDEGIERIGLEELRFDSGIWEVTLSFFRFRPSADGGSEFTREIASALRSLTNKEIVYKVIRIDDASDTVLELRNREPA